MRLFTRERSWRNFWVIVAFMVLCAAVVGILRPSSLWFIFATDAMLIALLLVDSWAAGVRQRRETGEE